MIQSHNLMERENNKQEQGDGDQFMTKGQLISFAYDVGLRSLFHWLSLQLQEDS